MSLKCINKRKAIRAVFSRLYASTLSMFDEETVDVVAVTAKFRVLETRYQELVALNDLVAEDLYEKTDSDLIVQVMLTEAETNEEYDIKYHTIKLKVEALLPIPHSEVSGKGTKIIPNLEFLQFDGDISQWLGFWSQFECVHLDKEFSGEAKFQCLIQATKPGSKARALVESFPPSAANYQKAIDQLRARHGRKDLLTEHYVGELLSLVLLNASRRDSLTLAQLTDRLETQLVALESLGVTSDKHACCMLYPLIESALPEAVLREWERCRRSFSGTGVDNASSSYGSVQIENLRAFLKREVESDKISMAKGRYNKVAQRS